MDNLGVNIGRGLASRIEKQLSKATSDALTFEDRSIRQVRGGWQQRYGALHTEEISNQRYALFGSVWGGTGSGGSTVGP